MEYKWERRFLALADQISSWSRDESTKVGCVIVGGNREVIATGYNGLPRGVDDSRIERSNRPLKYLWTEHAERNAIYNAALRGVKVEGSIMYCRYAPCMDCARACVQSGIGAFYYSQELESKRYSADKLCVPILFSEAGVKFERII